MTSFSFVKVELKMRSIFFSTLSLIFTHTGLHSQRQPDVLLFTQVSCKWSWTYKKIIIKYVIVMLRDGFHNNGTAILSFPIKCFLFSVKGNLWSFVMCFISRPKQHVGEKEKYMDVNDTRFERSENKKTKEGNTFNTFVWSIHTMSFGE